MNDNNFNKAKSNESFQGFCVNSTFSWSCERSQAFWSNSQWGGSLTPSTVKSKGTPSWTSDASKTAENMTHLAAGQVGAGNPVQVSNYIQNQKWGTPVTGTGGKWSDGGIATEKGLRYEGEIFSGNCINFLMLEVIYYL